MKTTILHKILFSAVAVLLTATMFTSCDSDVFNINADPFKGQKYINDLSSPISVYIESEPDFSEYAKALRYSETYNALNQSTSGVSFTAFVPNNDAMQEFYQRRGVSALEDLSVDYVRSFVLYHTVSDSITTEKFVTKTYVTNLEGEKLNITIDPENSGEAMLGDEGHIIEMGISAYNGKIYVMSSALTPLVETVYDRIAENAPGSSTIMQEAIDASGWKPSLSTLADTIVEDGRKTIIKHYYTLLNVTDEVFAKAGITSLSGLKSKLAENDAKGVGVDSLLREYVSYHIINNTYSIADFGGSESTQLEKLIGTTAKNQTLMLNIDTAATAVSDMYVFNKQAESASFVASSSDIRAKNGYVHSLDSWLPVWEPQPSEIIWDLADYAEIRAIVNADLYQPAEPVAKESSVRISSAACFNYEVGDGGTSNNSYSEIDYLTSKSYKVVGTSDVSTAYNNDRVVFNLGYMGWVEMTTPTIIKGKYRVEIAIGYLSSHSFMRTQSKGNGGLLKVSFDAREDATVYSSPYTTVPTQYAYGGIWSTVLFDEVEFPETVSHNFKMIIMDPAASSEKGFSIQIDYIRFIPID